MNPRQLARRCAGRTVRTLRLATALALACAAWPAASSSTDLASAGLDTLLDLEVSGASKFLLRASASPSTATVVTAEQMRALGHRTLADVLRAVQGVVVSSDRTYAYVGVRGFATPGDYNTRVLVLIDGNRLNDNVYDQAFLGSEFPLDLDLVERVEFIHGQGSAVHGANALFGVVNVVTRRGGVAVGREIAASIGDGGARQVRLSGNLPLGEGSNLLLSATLQRTAGTDAYYAPFDSPQTGNGISHDTDHERGRQLFAKWNQGELSATLIHGDRTKGLSANPGTVFNDPRSLYRDTLTLSDLVWKHRLGSAGTWNLRLYAGRYDFRGDYVVDYPPVTLNRDGARARWWGVDTHFSTERFEGHKLVVGGDLQVSTRQDQTNDDVWPVAASYLDDRRRGTRLSLFAEDHWRILPSLTLVAGARMDRHEGMAAQTSPRLSAVWRAEEHWTVKATHGEAFRPPNAYELYYSTPNTGGYKGNPDARSERVRGSELAVEWRPSASTRFSATAFSNQARGLLVQDVDPADGMLMFRNVGQMHFRGVDLEAEAAFGRGGLLRAGISAYHAHDLSGTELDSHSPHHSAKLVWVQPLAGPWTLGAEAIGVGRRGDVAGYGVANFTLSALVLADRALLSFSVYDAFDRQPSDPGSDSVLQPTAPHDGRSLRLKLETRF
jgi:outer membrane receptor protein involved in Fe transport